MVIKSQSPPLFIMILHIIRIIDVAPRAFSCHSLIIWQDDYNNTIVTDAEYAEMMLAKLARSKFRSSFRIRLKDREYYRKKGRDTINRHAYELLRDRVGVAEPHNDGKQTPFRGHPVFTAQHATATCCRGCIEKWHRIPKHRLLTEAELQRSTALVIAWMDQQMSE